MNSIQEFFNPLDYGFKFVGDWYEFNESEATTQAKNARDARAKQLKKEGWEIKKRKNKNSLFSRGGIGSGYPHIEMMVDVFCLEATKK